MKFRTKVIEKMSEMLAEEMQNYREELAKEGGVMIIEKEMHMREASQLRATANGGGIVSRLPCFACAARVLAGPKTA